MSFKELKVVHTGRPAPFSVTAPAYAAAAAAWLSASIVLVGAADELVAGAVTTSAPVLATHLIAVVFFPFAVAAAVWQLVPVMLRNDPPQSRRRPFVLALLLGGVPLAVGTARGSGVAIGVGAVLLAVGLALVLVELAAVVRNAPAGRTLAVSRLPLALAAPHVVLAFALGAVVAADGGPEPLGVPYERLLLIHLSLALVGWLTVLIAAVGRTLVPMLALAAAAEKRRLPFAEVGIIAGLWMLVIGLALDVDALAAAGVAGIVVSLVSPGRVFARAALRGGVGVREGPGGHVGIGLVALGQAAALAFLALAGAVDERRGAVAAVILLGLGWAGGVVLGHLGKLVSLSAWGSWPPGPRPSQADLYPRRVWQVESVLFALAVESIAVGVLVSSERTATGGALVLVLAALTAVAGVVLSVHRGVPGRHRR